MVTLDEIQAVYYMVAATGVLVAAIYYVMNIRTNQKMMKTTLESRQAQMLLTFFQGFNDPAFQKAFNEITHWTWSSNEEFWKRYGPDSPDKWMNRSKVGAYLEGLGVFVKNGLISAELVDDLMSGYVIGYWQRFRDITYDYRKIHNSPEAGEHIEYLYDKVYQIYRRQHPEVAMPISTQ